MAINLQTSTIAIEAYISLTRDLPKPTLDQMNDFAQYVSDAHSWYKHLPWYPPGSPFYVYVDPGAGMDRIIAPDGTTHIAEREQQGFHYSWIPTTKYRARFGHLAFSQSQGTSVSLTTSTGEKYLPSDNRPTIYDGRQNRIVAIPTQVLEVGTSYVSAIVHRRTGLAAAAMGLGNARMPPERSGNALFRKSRRNIDRLPPWPEESGGPDGFAKIIRRCRELTENPEIIRNPSPENTDGNRDPWGRSEIDVEVYKLLEPERSRQQREMVFACQRVVDLIWG